MHFDSKGFFDVELEGFHKSEQKYADGHILIVHTILTSEE